MARMRAGTRRQAILKATCREVITRGFAGTRVADVAGTLGISTGLVFYHFDSKDKLFGEAFRHAAEADLQQLATIANGGGTGLERLDRIFRLYAPGPDSEAWALWIDAWSQALRSEDLQQVSRELDLRWKETVATVIADATAAGECSCPDLSATAWRLTALMDGLAVQVVVHQGVLARHQMLEWVRAAAAAELGLDPAAASRGLAYGARRPHGATARGRAGRDGGGLEGRGGSA